MRPRRVIGFVLALGALTAVGASVALVLLSTIGGAPDNDPVGRLRPVASVTDGTTAPTSPGHPPPTATSPTTSTVDDDRRGRDDDVDRGGDTGRDGEETGRDDD